MTILYWLNLVELLKFITEKCTCKKENLSKNLNITIDTFIAIKWLFVFIVLVCDWRGLFFKYVLLYLIITNVFTYFYHHIWTLPKSKNRDFKWQRRRLFSLLLAILYSIFSFGVLYHQYYYGDFSSSLKVTFDFTDFFIFSLGTTFTGGTGAIAPNSNITHILASFQLFCSFLLISGVLAGTTISAAKEDEDVL